MTCFERYWREYDDIQKPECVVSLEIDKILFASGSCKHAGFKSRHSVCFLSNADSRFLSAFSMQTFYCGFHCVYLVLNVALFRKCTRQCVHVDVNQLWTNTQLDYVHCTVTIIQRVQYHTRVACTAVFLHVLPGVFCCYHKKTVLQTTRWSHQRFISRLQPYRTHPRVMVSVKDRTLTCGTQKCLQWLCNRHFD